jgi:hypothetical protein
MAYVPVEVWVPDTTEGPVIDSVQLKACDTCHAIILESQMENHVATTHEQEVTPH